MTVSGNEIDATTQVSDDDSVLVADELERYYQSSESMLASLLPGRDRKVRAVDGVSLNLREGETFGLVGESGCGKSTLGRVLVRLDRPTGGTLTYRGEDITNSSMRQLRPLRSEIQFIHQDPSSSLNPRKRVEQILERSFVIHTDLTAEERSARIDELLEQVGLDPARREKYPHELSGGQQQRVEIARALSVDPTLIVADEPTSALDVTVQAQILQLLEEIQAEFDLTMVFISHDLRTIRHITDRVGVMYLGELVEVGPTDAVFESPSHPYTMSLLRSVPTVTGTNRSRVRLEGQPPDPENPPSGCRFHTRCPVAQEVCGAVEPVERSAGENHTHHCHFGTVDLTEERVDDPSERVREYRE
ncbi:ABC transporter ATP-binding protein [Halovenus marina]|uniref:ABC transporter ATP-binding protein n=1 Tax=Halovenus marina TaxID=3396621 RepID=UPI003F54DC20